MSFLTEPTEEISQRLTGRAAAPPTTKLSAAELICTLEAFDPKPTDYFRHGLARIAQTINEIPPGDGNLLELGCDSHFTLSLLNYTKYNVFPQNSPKPFASPENVDNPEVVFTKRDGGIERFQRAIFDVERDEFPYEDNFFSGVLCCELLEHLFLDPAWMLMEAFRVLQPGGWLLLTTPNLTSYHSVRRAAQGIHPLEHSMYFCQEKYLGFQIQHTREYAFFEVVKLLEWCGFSIQKRQSFTFAKNERLGLWDYVVLVPALMLYNVLNLRHPKHLVPSLRKPHTFILARKTGQPQKRRPPFLYFS